MTKERERSEPEGEESFDAVLRRLAHASGPIASGPGLRLHPGSLLLDGRFRITRRIGQGGMGVVYEAQDARRRGAVALKTLSRLDAGNVYRLKNEFRSLAEVNHRNVCRLHELFGEGDLWFFTMELVEGEPFDRWVRPDGALDEGRLRAALPQLCEGIAAVHAADKLHRDLKPSNVLVTPDARVVVLDFGLAVAPELGGAGNTVEGESVSGTPAYMAPEQAAGLAATTASDLYALGVMLFEALTGELPFEGRAHEMLMNRQRQAAPSALARNPEAPADLAGLSQALLSREPAARPDLAALRAQLGFAPAPSSTLPPSSLSARESLLGREPELAVLREAYAATLAGQAVVLFVGGESGMGKSALVGHFLDELRAQGHAAVLAGRCYERENVPFKAFDALIDELSRMLRKLPEGEAGSLLPREVYALARLFPALDRVRVVADAPHKAVTDPQDVQRRAFQAFGELLARMRDRQPLVLFIDDLQWTDRDSATFLRHLLVHPEPVPALFIASHRSEGAQDNALLRALIEAASENRAISMRNLGVGPLPEAAAAELAAGLLGCRAADASAHAVARESGGSPFFAGELARAVERRGAHRLSLDDALAAHVAALGEGAQRLLQVLALAGQPLPVTVVLDAAGLPEAHGELDTLCRERLVRVSGGSEGLHAVECYHDKIRESVTAALPASTIRELAGGLARVLAAQPDADPELLTRCLEAAGETQRAAEHAAAAAATADAALAFDRAARLYEQALALGAFEPPRAHGLRLARARALAHTGRGVVAAEAYLEALPSAAAEEAPELSRLAAEQYLMCGRLEQGRALMAQALRPLGIAFPRSFAATMAAFAYQRSRLRLRGLRLAARSGVDGDVLRQLDVLAAVTPAMLRCDPVRAAAFSALSARRALDAGDCARAARALGWDILLAAAVGTSPAALSALTARARELCELANDPAAWEALYFGSGFAGWFGGDSAGSLELFDRCRALYAEQPQLAAFNAAWAELFRAYQLTGLGRVHEVAETLPAHIERARARSDLTLLPMWAGGTAAIARVAVGQVAEAQREIARAGADWQTSEVTNQDFTLAFGACYVAIYAGSAREAWEGLQAFERRVNASAMARTTVRESMLDMFASAALGLAAETRNAAERRDLLKIAARSVPARDRTAVMFAAPVRAALAFQQGKPELAVDALRAFMARTHMPPLFAQAARRRLGVLLGGDEGKALVAQADAFFRAGGTVDPERLTAALAPGFEPAAAG